MLIPSLQTDSYRLGRWFGILAVTQALLLVSAAHANQAPQSPAESGSKPTAAEPFKFLKNNGFFRSLHGYYFLENDRLHAYRELRKAMNSKTGELETVPENDDQQPLWKGEPYYHEVYHLDEQGEWMPKAWGPVQLKDRSFSQVPKRFLDFGGCDKKDLISVNRPEIKAALPGSAKIKKVAKYGNYAMVVYTDVPATRPVIQHKSWARPRRQMGPPKPTDRAVHVVLLKQEKGKQKTWVSAHQKLDSAIPASFCGTREISTSVDGKTRPNLLVFSQQGEYAIGNSYTLWDWQREPRPLANK